MASNQQMLTVLIAVVAAAAISFALTPLVKRFAEHFGFIDTPKDNRRMHKRPIPTIGGLAIYAAFVLVVLTLFGITRQLVGILAGATVLVVLGMLDDKYDLNAKLKFAVQIIAAILPVSQGIVVDFFTNPLPVGPPILSLGVLSAPLTVFWIVAITNAVNFIDGLDGLSVGICSISSLTMGVIALTMGQYTEALMLGALLGACVGFLPYNLNPAKIFMGDTGATFLGFILACMSVSGLFKLYTVISFAVPILVLGVPIFDITFAFLRRILRHENPMKPDRSHIHHQLVDRGFTQRQSVTILYVVASLFGACAVMISTSGAGKALMVLIAAVGVSILGLFTLAKMPEEQKDAEDSPEPPDQRPEGEKDPADTQDPSEK